MSLRIEFRSPRYAITPRGRRALEEDATRRTTLRAIVVRIGDPRAKAALRRD